MSAPTGAELRLIGSLKDHVGGRESVRVEAGQTVRQALTVLGIRPEIVALVIVNGAHQAKDYRLMDGDLVELLAVIGGGEARMRDRGWGTRGGGASRAALRFADGQPGRRPASWLLRVAPCETLRHRSSAPGASGTENGELRTEDGECGLPVLLV